jgi:hypothetical protein
MAKNMNVSVQGTEKSRTAASISSAPLAGQGASSPQGAPSPRSAALYWSGVALVAASWISAAAFGLYILGFYLGAIRTGQMEQWNENLTGLYDKHAPLAFLAMAVHLAMGAVILLLGPVQLIGTVRSRWPAVHRWIGRLYVFTSALAGLGGLVFIATKGTIGGAAMNTGFGLYGTLMVLAAVETYRHARARRFEAHRAWAIRLFALAIGSWLYRMDYGFWLLAMHRLGHLENFRGPFDVIMSFFFYLPNLAVAEIFLRARRTPSHPVFRVFAVVVMNIATLVVGVGTYYFVRYYWGPGIVHGLLGRSG